MLRIRIKPALERILSAATAFLRVIVLEIGIQKLLPYSWIPEGRRGFDFNFSVFFFFNALVSARRILLQPSESPPIGSFWYSTTTAQPLLLNPQS